LVDFVGRPEEIDGTSRWFSLPYDLLSVEDFFCALPM
jgi:hypothetical protein